MEGYKRLLREFFSDFAAAVRRKRRLTQEAMAERLRITARAYSDLERGKFAFSSTALLFLILMLEQQELGEMLKTLRERLEIYENTGVA